MGALVTVAKHTPALPCTRARLDHAPCAHIGALASCAHGSREVAAAGHTSSRACAADDWAGWFGSRPNWLQLVSRCGRVCVARTASPDLDLFQRVEHMLVEVDVCVAPEPHGLGMGGSNVSGMVVACPVVGPVPVGCSRARSTVDIRSDHFLSGFGPSGAATRQTCVRLPWTHTDTIGGLPFGVGTFTCQKRDRLRSLSRRRHRPAAGRPSMA